MTADMLNQYIYGDFENNKNYMLAIIKRTSEYYEQNNCPKELETAATNCFTLLA